MAQALQQQGIESKAIDPIILVGGSHIERQPPSCEVVSVHKNPIADQSPP